MEVKKKKKMMGIITARMRNVSTIIFLDNYMKEEDKIWLAEILEKSPLLFYGEFEVYLNTFLKEVFITDDLSIYGFDDAGKDNNFNTAYWFLISWLEKEKMFQYGTSPRSGWLTDKGKRFKSLILNNENAIEEAQEFVYRTGETGEQPTFKAAYFGVNIFKQQIILQEMNLPKKK